MTSFGNKFNLEVKPVFTFSEAPPWYWQEIKSIDAELSEKEFDGWAKGWNKMLKKNKGWKDLVENMVEKISPGPLDACQCSMCAANEEEKDYWILWKEAQCSEYVCPACHDSTDKWAKAGDSLAWLNAELNHDNNESHNLWEQFHDFFQEHTGVDVNEEHAQQAVHHAQETATSWWPF